MNFSEIVDILSKNGLVTDRSLRFNPQIKKIVNNSKESDEHSLFFCIRGTKFDSHKIATNLKAAALVCEKPVKVDKPYVIVKDSRKALAVVAYEFYAKVYKKMKLFAVTGTKGKTTAVTLFKKIIEESGQKCALTSTVSNETPSRREYSEHTTQDPLYTAKLLGDAFKEGATFASIEASSQGLAMKRLDGLSFDKIAFLNLSRDHFDTHVNFENYFHSKLHLLDLLKKNGTLYVNSNGGKWAKLYAEEAKKRGFETITFGKRGEVKLEIHESAKGVSFILKRGKNISSFHSSVLGGFMAENMVAAILAAHDFGVSDEVIERAVKKFNGVEGRMERYKGKGYDFMVDFAHTPASLEAMLKSVRKLVNGRILLVFGAGGEADRGKRPLMGKAAQKYADLIFLTNDNPKGEVPSVIISEVASGISKTEKLRIVPDRRQAIKRAFEEWKEGDIVIMAGKGHERAQIFDGYEIIFNDRDVAFEILKELKGIEIVRSSG